MSLREAALRALEALDWYAECAMVSDKAADAASALRAALEQYDKDRVWIEERKANWALQRKLITETPERDKQQQEYEEARSAALEQPERAQAMRDAGYTRRPTIREMAEPEQEEPVAWMWDQQARRSSTGIGGWDKQLLFCRPAEDPFVPKRNITPLYTHPPRRAWRGLTEEDRSVLFSTHFNSPYELVNAIEAALKERNA